MQNGIRDLDWECDIPPSQQAVPTVRVATTARAPPFSSVYMTDDLDRAGESKPGQQPPYNKNHIKVSFAQSHMQCYQPQQKTSHTGIWNSHGHQSYPKLCKYPYGQT